MIDLIPGQRCISDAELQMGLGSVVEAEVRTITVLFSACDETRTYARQSAPLTRVVFDIGDRVSNRDGLSIDITSVQESGGLLVYTGKDSNGQAHIIAEQQLDDRIELNRPLERLLNGQVDSDQLFSLRCSTLNLTHTLANSDLYGLAGCRTSLLKHQLYIAHEVASRYSPRVLLADEVGLGKTIEAGLILHQQLLSERAHRVLIVVPSSLIHQWLVEMLRRFNLHFSIFDEERCESIEESGNVSNPFLGHQLVLCSLEFLVGDENRSLQCEQAEWDMLVVDEAHHLRWSPEQSSDEYSVIEKLAVVTRGVLLLTATPEQLGRESHFARLRLLDPDRFPDLDSFSREQQEYEPIAQAAQALLTDQPLGDDEYSAIDGVINEENNRHLLASIRSTEVNAKEHRAARQVLFEHLLDRHGTGRVLFRNTRDTVKGFPGREVHMYALIAPDEYSQVSTEGSDDVQGLLAPEILYRASSNDGGWVSFDPRVSWLSAKLQELKPEKVLVITATAQTAIELAQVLKASTGLVASVFHEGLSIVERDRAAAYFADSEDGGQVLICSEIGSEGRNFQFAHNMVLLDVPLNPDLLEQRIGRLDRIGQSSTIHIHIPYLEDTAQHKMVRWYDEGLSAFSHTSSTGASVFSQFESQLIDALRSESGEIEQLINETRKVHNELKQALHRGRDRLLEYNSCRPAEADELVASAVQFEREQQLSDYMDLLFDCYGIDTELHRASCYYIKPTNHMLHPYPGLPENGMTLTYSRAYALSNEDVHYLSWEHPLVASGMDMVLSSENGNTSLVAVKYKGVEAGSLMLECLFVVEIAPVEKLQTTRYLPPATIRIVIDEKSRIHKKLTTDIINSSMTEVNRDTAAQVVQVKNADIRSMLEYAEKAAATKKSSILSDAHKNAHQILSNEINRLKTLGAINRNVRTEEIDHFEQQLGALDSAINTANLRLDAIRVLVII